MQFTEEDFHIDLDQDQYEEFLERVRGVEVSETDEKNFEEIVFIGGVVKLLLQTSLQFQHQAESIKGALQTDTVSMNTIDYRSYTHNLSSCEIN